MRGRRSAVTEGFTERPRGSEVCGVEWQHLHAEHGRRQHWGGEVCRGSMYRADNLEKEERWLNKCKTYFMRRCFVSNGDFSVHFSTAAALKLVTGRRRSAQVHRRRAEVSARDFSAQETIRRRRRRIHVKPLLVLCF